VIFKSDLEGVSETEKIKILREIRSSIKCRCCYG
jgi:hypothetical protein